MASYRLKLALRRGRPARAPRCPLYPRKRTNAGATRPRQVRISLRSRRRLSNGKQRPTLFRLKAFRLEHGSSVCSFKKLDERLRRLGCIGAGSDSGSEDCHACELPWQRPNQLRARHGHDLRSLPDADLGFAPGDDIGGLCRSGQSDFLF
jgi:hypothetical protein